MAAKRALIVDDSKSARVVLARMLERYGIQVDASESAEDAIEYLKSNRPDVIFMDHLMPGMDGFQAVQAIKSNPLTATLPIMMYTSQEGELYVGQARALGAIGVMPKQVAPVDVSKVLYQLKLLPDRRDTRPSVLQPVGVPLLEAAAVPSLVPLAATGTGVAAGTGPAAAGADTVPANPGSGAPPLHPALPLPPLTTADVRAIVEPALKEQSAELRRFVVASLDSFAARVTTETRDLVTALAPPPVPPAPAPEPVPVPVPPPPARPTGWIVLAVAGCLAAVGTGVLAWQQYTTLHTLELRLAEESRAVAAVRAELAGLAAPAPPAAEPEAATPVAMPSPRTFEVPYGEPPLAGTRVDALRALFADPELEAFTGTVRITSHVGDFCLVGNAAEGYAPAPGEMTANRCDLVGNPFDDGLRPAQRQSVAFANWLAEARAQADGRYAIVVAHAARDGSAAAYPEAAEASAEAWNAAAGANHRVEVEFVAGGAP